MNKINLNDIQIRNTLLPGDLGYIAYLHGLVYADECGYGIDFEAYVLGGLKDFAKAYDPDQDKVWICEHQGKIVGCLVAQHRAEALQFRYFVFLAEYRGIGLGKLLMQAFVDFMEEQGIKYAYLWTTADQQTAMVLYERYGFRLVEEIDSEAFGRPIIERRYDLHLS